MLSNPDTLMPPHGPYSQIAATKELVFLAGQGGRDRTGRLVGTTITTQVQQAFQNVATALESQGSSMAAVVKLTMYVVGRDQVPEFAEATDALLPALFPSGMPAATLLLVPGLFDPDMLVEIDAIATRAIPEH